MDITEDEDTKAQQWREARLRSCLRFLVLSNREKLDYLPASFSEMTFHGDTGDFVTGDPLKFICFLVEDVSLRCHTYFDKVNQRLRELRILLDLMYWSKNDAIWNLHLCISQRRSGTQWAYVWDMLARLSKKVLALLEWSVEPPDLSCETLLDEYSYGGYSAIVYSK